MPIQKCPLCLETKKVVRSHLIPKAVYNYCRPPGGNPISVTSELVVETSRQLQHHLLCKICEGVLNEGGEDWLIPLLARYRGAFPFYNFFSTVAPDVTYEGFAGYASVRNTAIKTDKLIHFAMGVFWKAAVHSWKKAKTGPMIELGFYAEPMRQFLLGEAGFPDHMALMVGVVPPPVNEISFCPPFRGSKAEYHNFLFYLPGLFVTLCVGKKVDTEVRMSCFATNPLHPVLVGDLTPDIRRIFANAFRKAKKARNVRKYFKPPA